MVSVSYSADGAKGYFEFGSADKALALRLVAAGPDHGKFLRQLPVVLDVTAPESWWWQFDTYKIGTTRNSTSTMHMLGKKELTADMFDWGTMPQAVQTDLLHIANDLRLDWIAAGRRKGPDEEEWEALVNGVSRGLLFRSCWSANYQVLRSIYHARRHHRFGNWRVFCAWIEQLPHADLMTAPAGRGG